MNIKLLRKIQRAIRKEPRQFDMDSWFEFDKRTPNCGTTACIAGWAIALSSKKNPLDAAKSIRKRFGRGMRVLSSKQAYGITAKVLKVLKIDMRQGDSLFYASYWPLNFPERFRNARTPEEKAEIACERIDAFIANS